MACHLFFPGVALSAQGVTLVSTSLLSKLSLNSCLLLRANG